MKTMAERIREGREAWARRQMLGSLKIGANRLSRLESGEDLPKNIVEATKIALFLGLKFQPFIKQWIREMNQRYGDNRTRFTVSNLGLLLLYSIAQTDASSLREFAVLYDYSYANIKGWIRGVTIPSSASRRKLGKDLHLDSQKLEGACRKAARARKRRGGYYPSRVACMVGQVMRERNLSFGAVEDMGFNRGAVWNLLEIGDPIYSIISGRFFELSDTLGISRLEMLLCYLLDNIDRDRSELNLVKVPFISAKLILWLGLIRGLVAGQTALTPRRLAIATGFSVTKMAQFIKGKYLLERGELDKLLGFLEPDDTDLKLIDTVWQIEHDVFQREQSRKQRASIEIEERLRRANPQERIEIYKEITSGVPLKTILSPLQRARLKLRFQQGLSYDDIGEQESVSRASAHRAVRRALQGIQLWREKQ